ncbi:MAG: helix-turn-helix transcriptional regulator, partial [Ginsengibacter sp.]
RKIQVSQSTIGDIERGRISVSKKVAAKILKSFNDKVKDFFNDNGTFNIEYFNKTNGGKSEGLDASDNLVHESESKKSVNAEESKKRYALYYSYMTKFKEAINKELPEANQFSEFILDIFELGDITEVLHQSKIGDVIFFGTDNILKLKSFQEFKEAGLKVYKDALPHKKAVQEFAKSVKKFRDYLESVKDEIELDYSFDEK